MSKLKPTLSFQVVGLTKRVDRGCVYWETQLLCYNNGEKLTVRGAPWTLGDKVDFKMFKVEHIEKGAKTSRALNAS